LHKPKKGGKGRARKNSEIDAQPRLFDR
jgi:hypothetical protein